MFGALFPDIFIHPWRPRCVSWSFVNLRAGLDYARANCAVTEVPLRMAYDTRLHATVGFDSFQGTELIAGLVEGAVPQLERHEDAAGLESMASDLRGGPVGSIPTRKTKAVKFAEKRGLSFCFKKDTTDERTGRHV